MLRRLACMLALAASLPQLLNAAQLVAGSPEETVFTQISSESNPENKLQRIADFEARFPQSRALASVYLMAVDLYRDKGDRAKVIEYGEKVLKHDERNVTAMMVLSRNYGMEGKNLDRAVELAQRAVDQIAKMKADPAPATRTETQWKEYLQNTDAAARSILEYAKSVQQRESKITQREAQ